MFDFLNEKDRQPPTLPQGTVRRRYSIEGQVQGVGFRWTNQGLARELGLTGWARNLEDGSVAMEVQGAPAAIALEFDRLHESYQRLSIGRVWLKESRQLPVNHTETDFEIRY